MREFLFRGTATFSGVDFTVLADDLEATKRRAASGKFDEYDVSRAEAVDFSIDLSSGKLNK